MASRRPNALGDALERFGDNLLKVAMFNVQTGLDRERIAQEQERIGLAADAAAEARKVNAHSRALSFLPFVENGTTLAENTFLHDSVREAWGEDPTDVGPGGIGNLVFTPETIESVIRPLEIDYFNSLPEEHRNNIMDRRVNRAVLGQPISPEDITLQNSVTGMRLAAIDSWRADPVALQTIARGTLGLEPITRVELPGGGIAEYDTVASANLSVELLKHSTGLDFQLDMAELSAGAKMDLAGELVKQAQEFAGIGISRSRAIEIIEAVHSEDPTAAIAEMRARGLSPELEVVIDMYINGAEIARSAIPMFMRQYEDMSNFNLMGEAMKNIFGADAMSLVLPEYNRIMYERGQNVPRPSAAWQTWRQGGLGGGKAERPPGPRREPEEGADSTGADSGISEVDQMEQAVSAYIGGTMSVSDIRRKFSSSQANTILREAAYRRRQR